MINYKKADLNELDQIIRCRMEFIREDMGPQTPEIEAAIQTQLQEYLKNHLNRDCFVFAAEEDEKIISIAFLMIQEKPAPMGYSLYKKLGFEDACSRCKEMEYHWV